MNKLIHLFPVCLFSIPFLSAQLSSWQTPAPAPVSRAAAPAATPPTKWHGWVVTALGDGYFTFNFNHPSSGANQLQNFNLNYGQPELSLAKVTMDKSDQHLGLHVDAGFGETMRFIHATDPAPQGFRYIEQMYLILKPKHAHGAEIDFGEFVTSAGAEVIEANANWNYSRSLLFALATPYYHFGFRATVPISKSYTAGIQVVNAWNTLWGNNNLKNIGITSALTRPKYTWSTNYYEGPNHPGTTRGKRNLFDTTLLLTPTSKAKFYINYDYGQDNRIGGGHDSWCGIAGAAHFQLTNKIALSPRAEWYRDATGFTTGTEQELKEATITGEYKHNDHVIARLEYRHDASDVPFFDRGAQTAQRKRLNSATIGLVILLGPLK